MNINLHNQDTVAFAISSYPNNDNVKKLHETSLQNIFLLSPINSISFFNQIPKNFTISTKNSKCVFNLEMLKEASPVISDLIKSNPNERQYFLEINDEENVLSKFEQLFLGQTVRFVEDDFHCSKQITKFLQISNCPHYLKPQTFRRNFRAELRSSSMYGSSTLPVKIHIKYFINFLKREVYQSFKIITKKNEYICNIFGVYSSKIIHQILDEDQNANQYVYDFDDEEGEFQSICDFFNFNEVGLNRNNMYSIKKIVEDLQINCILSQVYEYIINYDINNQKINEKQKIIDTIDQLFDFLFNIKTIGIENVKNFICQSKFSTKKEKVQELAAFILQVVKPTFSLQKEMAELLIQLNKEANESNQLSLLIPFIVDNLMNYYMPWQLQNDSSLIICINEPIDQTNKCIYSFIRLLYKKGIISKEMIFEKLKNYDCSNMSINAFFLPEIIEINPKNKNLILIMNSNQEIKQQHLNFILYVQKYLPDKIDLYEKMLDDMMPCDELTKSIKLDDVDRMQSIITINSIDFNDIAVPYNIFDDFEQCTKIIDYAALCGSIKCFKYLLLNNGEINEKTFYSAVYGGNVEIIKIVEQNMKDVTYFTRISTNASSYKYDIYTKLNTSVLWFKYFDKFEYGFNNYSENNFIDLMPNNEAMEKKIHEYYNNYMYLIITNNLSITCLKYCNINNIIASTIAMHRYDLFDWIFEKEYLNKRIKGDELTDLAILSAATGNAHSLIKIIDEGFDITTNFAFNDMIYFCAKNGFYKLLKLILSIIKIKFFFNDQNSFIVKSSVLFGNLSIFKLFLKIDMPSKYFRENIINVINMNYKDIIFYCIDNIDKIYPQCDQIFANTLLKHALKNTKSGDLFISMIEKFKKINPMFINTYVFIDLLDTACLYSNLSATKYMTDFILSEFPETDFSSAFIAASCFGSTDICYYFINKKVSINYYELLSDVDKLGSMDAELFETIYNKVDENTKYQLGCIDQAIEKKNKKLIEFLLKQNISIPDGLICAVKTHDVEIVDLILKYNSETSFVNQLIKGGTAIFYASAYKDFDIVKRLLSVPGIDPGLFNNETKNALTAAINNYDYDIVEAILNFYGDDIASNIYVVSTAFQAFQNCLNKQQATDSYLWKIIKKFMSIKSIDPNYIINSTLLYKACENNEIEVVEYLLTLDRIDVNQYDIVTYNTPLIISIAKKNTKIAELLINHPKTNVNFKNINNESALILAVKNNLERVIDLLVNDKRFNQCESNLCYALIISNDEIFEKLCSLDFIDVNNYFILSKRNKNNNIFTNKGLYTNFRTTSLVHFAKTNDINRIDAIIKHPSFDGNKSNVNLAIFYSIKENNIDLFRKLIKIIDNDVNIYDKHGRSFLLTAALYSSGDIIDEIFRNPKFDARKNQIFRAFVDSYANPFIYKNKPNQQIINPPMNYHPQTVLNQQLLPNKSTIVEIMEKIINYDESHDHLIDLNKLTHDGKSVFTSIRYNNDETKQITELLLNHGADPNVLDSEGVPPLKYAMLQQQNMFIPLLNSNKIDFEKRFLHSFNDSNQLKQKLIKTTYFHIAASLNSDLFNILLDKYPTGICATDEYGKTPPINANRPLNNMLFNEYNLFFPSF